MSVPQPDKPAVFFAESIRAMSPCGRGIAQILQNAGWIRIVDKDVPGQPGAQKNGISSSSN